MTNIIVFREKTRSNIIENLGKGAAVANGCLLPLRNQKGLRASLTSPPDLEGRGMKVSGCSPQFNVEGDAK